VDKDLRKAAKDGILNDDATGNRFAGPEATPNPPTGFRVMFLAFVLRGLSFPPARLPAWPPFRLRDSAARSESQHNSSHSVFHHAM
jgi:hypothetical protein